MNYPSCVMSYKFLEDDVMEYISHPNVLSSWILGFLTYHANWGDLFLNALCISNLWTSSVVYAAQNHFVTYWLLSRRPSLTMLCMILFCFSLLPLSQYASPPVSPWIFWILQWLSWLHLLIFPRRHLHQPLYFCMGVFIYSDF